VRGFIAFKAARLKIAVKSAPLAEKTSKKRLFYKSI